MKKNAGCVMKLNQQIILTNQFVVSLVMLMNVEKMVENN